MARLHRRASGRGVTPERAAARMQNMPGTGDVTRYDRVAPANCMQ